MKILPLRSDRRSGFSLIELLVVLIIGTGVLMAIFSVSAFTSKQVGIYVERYDMYSQMNYALDTMAAVFPAAISIEEGSMFAHRSSVLVNERFAFQGENNIYEVTPVTMSDNADYALEIDANKNLVLVKEFEGNVETDILVEGKYEPSLRMEVGSEPNFMFVTIAAKSAKKNLSGLSRSIAKVEGIRFWFVDLVKK